nr:putative pre-16S rRNA nuclease [Ipomoea batatas]
MCSRSIFGGANGIMGTAKQLVSVGLSLPIPPSPVARKRISRLNFVRLTLQTNAIRAALSIDEIPPNALRQARESGLSSCGFSLGVDLGLSRTGLALSKGFSFRPLTVLELRGQKLEVRLIDIAQKQEVDEFIIGLPLSSDGKETPQSNKVRSVAGRLAVRAAEKGLGKSARQGKLDAYAAVMVLERYFSASGEGIELVLPKQLELQNKLGKASSMEDEFDS